MEEERYAETGEQQAVQWSNAIVEDLYWTWATNGWMMLCVWGPQGSGKTTVALDCLGEFWLWDWKTAFRYLIFTPEELFAWLDYAKRQQELDEERGVPPSRRYRIPILVIDDAGVYFGAYRWNEPWAQRLSEEWKALRTLCNNWIITTPDPNDVLPCFRKSYTHHAIIKEKLGTVSFDGWPHCGVDYQALRIHPRFRARTLESPAYYQMRWVQQIYFPMVSLDVYEFYLGVRQDRLHSLKFIELEEANVERIKKALLNRDIELLMIFDRRYKISTRLFRARGSLENYKRQYLKLVKLGLLEFDENRQYVYLTKLGEEIIEELKKRKTV